MNINDKIPVITIDGPSAVGKSALSKVIARKLNWFVLESGILYRKIALLILQKKIPISERYIIPLIKNLNFKKKIINHIHLNAVSEIASKIANFYEVRKILLGQQRAFRIFPGLVAEGRDMGTVVFPDAIVQFFLYANLKSRVHRRILQLKKNGDHINSQELYNQIRMRDQRDRNRLISPLYPSRNAIILDSTNMSFSEVINISMIYIFERIHKNALYKNILFNKDYYKKYSQPHFSMKLK